MALQWVIKTNIFPSKITGVFKDDYTKFVEFLKKIFMDLLREFPKFSRNQ
jgi:hypothetical protein